MNQKTAKLLRRIARKHGVDAKAMKWRWRKASPEDNEKAKAKMQREAKR